MGGANEKSKPVGDEIPAAPSALDARSPCLQCTRGSYRVDSAAGTATRAVRCNHSGLRVFRAISR
jgi:hypothetical protein